MAGPPLDPDEILASLRELAGISEPLWLTGGVAVDFLAGRWTRPHSDIDLCALAGRRWAGASSCRRRRWWRCWPC